MNKNELSTLTKKELITMAKEAGLDPYNHCLFSKQHRVFFNFSPTRRSELLILVYSDIMVPWKLNY